MPRPRIFIGSSSEQLVLARAIEVWLDERGCETVLWTGVFEPGDYTAERLIQQAGRCDGAVMIFGKDDRTWFREEHLHSPRDNVVYELGLFTGAAKDNPLKRVIFVRVGDTKIASDLKGLGYLPVDPANPTGPQVREEIYKFANRIGTMEQAYDPRLFKVTGKRELFEAGSTLIARPISHVTLAAKTPVPLMGTRPYDRKTASFDYEEEQYNLYWSVAEKAARGELDFILIASLPSIIEDLTETRSSAFHEHVHANLHRMFALMEGSGSKARLYWHEGLCPPAFLVTDSTALVWWKAGNGDSIWLTHQSHALAQSLRSSRPGTYVEYTYDEVASRIGTAIGADATR